VKHSLRLRLTLACVALLAVVLIGVGMVTYRLVDSFLVQRIDQQLADRATGAANANSRLFVPGNGPPPDYLRNSGPRFLRNSLIFGVVNSAGHVIGTTNGVSLSHLPSGLPGSTKDPGLSDKRSFDVSIG